MCVCMYAYIYIYVYIYVYIHTFIYTRTHTYILCGSPHLCQTAVSLAWQADIHAHPRRYLDVSRGQVVGVGLVSSGEEKKSLQTAGALCAYVIRLGVSSDQTTKRLTGCRRRPGQQCRGEKVTTGALCVGLWNPSSPRCFTTKPKKWARKELERSKKHEITVPRPLSSTHRYVITAQLGFQLAVLAFAQCNHDSNSSPTDHPLRYLDVSRGQVVGVGLVSSGEGRGHHRSYLQAKGGGQHRSHLIQGCHNRSTCIQGVGRWNVTWIGALCAYVIQLAWSAV